MSKYILTSMCILWLTACSQQVRTEYIVKYETVAIPTTCKLESYPERPVVKTKEDFTATVINLLEYIELLEASLHFCVTPQENRHE